MKSLSKFIGAIIVFCMLGIGASTSYADVNSAIQVFNQTHQQQVHTLPSQSTLVP
ncbi:hypothetical protein L3V83_08755 [Thiotrichales bacterium 19X7-9]|nr:hypothetical protein [Thiotrichales bacterium 19X7-9]